MKRSAHRIRFRLPRMARYRAQASQRQDRRGRGEQGAALVETAFSMIILLTIVFGIMKMCMALYTYHFVSDAAREGARFAIVRGASCAAPGYECNATAAQIQTYVQYLGYPGIDPSAMKVNTTWSAYPSGSCVAVGCNGAGDMVTVTVTYKFPLSIPFVPSRILNMSSTSAMIISQ